jgi:hypothetical protein
MAANKPQFQVVLDRMDDQMLICCWEAIENGGLQNEPDSKEINGIPIDEWIERVYMEMTRRELL